MSEMGIHDKDGNDEKLPGFGSEARAGRRLLASTTLEQANVAMRDYERYENSGRRRQQRRLRVAKSMMAALGQLDFAASRPSGPHGPIEASPEHRYD